MTEKKLYNLHQRVHREPIISIMCDPGFEGSFSHYPIIKHVESNTGISNFASSVVTLKGENLVNEGLVESEVCPTSVCHLSASKKELVAPVRIRENLVFHLWCYVPDYINLWTLFINS